MADHWKDRLREFARATFGASQSDQTKPKKRRPPAPEVIYKPPKARATATGGDSSAKVRNPSEPPRASEAKVPLPPHEQPSGSGLTINIGIDLGTSTTKVCARSVREFRERGPVFGLTLREPTSSADDYLCPSLVTIDDDRVYFGFEAAVRSSDGEPMVLRHLKVCLACEAEWNGGTPVTGCLSVRGSDPGSCSGRFLCGCEGGRKLAASELLTLLLAWQMRESRRRLPHELTGGKEQRVTYSLSAPLDQIDSSRALREAYERIAFKSWRLSTAIEQGVPVVRAVEWLDEVSRLPLPPEGERMVVVCSEACATIASYVLSPEMQEGLYCLVDIGAWTTDISFFRITEISRSQTGVPTTAFYAARCHRKAANAIDERCLGAVLELFGEQSGADEAVVNQIREQRESEEFAATPLQLGATSWVPPRIALQYARAVVGAGVGRSFMETLKQAYAKENRQSVWATTRVKVFMSGGGAREEALRQNVAHHWIASLGPVPRPSNLVAPNCDYSRMSVAYGLAFPVALWPTEIPPSGVEPIGRLESRRPDSHDLGFGQ